MAVHIIIILLMGVGIGTRVDGKLDNNFTLLPLPHRVKFVIFIFTPTYRGVGQLDVNRVGGVVVVRFLLPLDHTAVNFFAIANLILKLPCG